MFHFSILIKFFSVFLACCAVLFGFFIAMLVPLDKRAKAWLLEVVGRCVGTCALLNSGFSGRGSSLKRAPSLRGAPARRGAPALHILRVAAHFDAFDSVEEGGPPPTHISKIPLRKTIGTQCSTNCFNATQFAQNYMQERLALV